MIQSFCSNDKGLRGIKCGSGQWPGSDAEVSVYSADGRMVGSKPINNDRVEFRELRPGVYYLWVKSESTAIKEKVLVR